MSLDSPRREARGLPEIGVKLDFDENVPKPDDVGTPGADDQQEKEDTLNYPWCVRHTYDTPGFVLL